MKQNYPWATKYSLCIAAFALASSLAKAEQLDSVRYSNDLDELTVTATKRNVLKKDLSSSVSILGKQLLEQTQFQGIKDINAHIPNVYIPDFGSSLSTPIFIRGIGSRRINMIGLYSDGVPLLEAGSIDTDYSGVRSIEVLRGPQGTLYGRGAMGGIINLRSYRPLDYQKTHLNFTAGEYGLYGLNAQSYQRVNDKLGFGANLSYQHKDGYYINKFDNSSADKSNSYATKFSLQYRHEGWDIYGFVQYQRRNQKGYPYALLDKEGKLGDVNYNTPSHYWRNLLTTGLSIEKTWHNGLNLKSATSYQHLKDEMLMDQDFSPAPMITALQNTNKHVVTHESSLSRKRGRYTWITGVYGFGIDSDKTLDNDINMAPRRVVNMMISYGEPSYGFALFHQSNYKITDRLTAELGLRYDWEWSKQNYRNVTTDKLSNKVAPAVEKPASAIDKQFTPKFSLNYRIGEAQHIYATVLRGYQSSGFNVQFDTPEEQVYKPEYSWNYELGTHLSLLEHRLQVDAAVFCIDWEQQQVQLPIFTGLGSKIVNAGQSRSYGAELAIVYRPIEGLNLRASYGYTNAKFVEYEEKRRAPQAPAGNPTTGAKPNAGGRPNTGGNPTAGQPANPANNAGAAVAPTIVISHHGKYIPQVPQHTVAASADYTYQAGLSWLDFVKAGVQYRGLGDIYWDNANTQKQGFYSVVDAQLSFGYKAVALELWGRNLTNNLHKTYQFSSQGRNLAQRGLQRHFGATLRVKF